MEEVQELLATAAEERGWSFAKKLEVICAFLADQDLLEDFETYLNDIDDETGPSSG